MCECFKHENYNTYIIKVAKCFNCQEKYNEIKVFYVIHMNMFVYICYPNSTID